MHSLIHPLTHPGIVVLEVFRIDSPYEKVTQVKGSGAADDAGMQRVVTVLEGKSSIWTSHKNPLKTTIFLPKSLYPSCHIHKFNFHFYSHLPLPMSNV